MNGGCVAPCFVAAPHATPAPAPRSVGAGAQAACGPSAVWLPGAAHVRHAAAGQRAARLPAAPGHAGPAAHAPAAVRHAVWAARRRAAVWHAHAAPGHGAAWGAAARRAVRRGAERARAGHGPGRDAARAGPRGGASRRAAGRHAAALPDRRGRRPAWRRTCRGAQRPRARSAGRRHSGSAAAEPALPHRCRPPPAVLVTVAASRTGTTEHSGFSGSQSAAVVARSAPPAQMGRGYAA